MVEFIVLAGSTKEVAIVDEEDLAELLKFKWYLSSTGYACNLEYVKGSGKKEQKTVSRSMHRVIMKAPKGVQVDHINGNRLDNRRENLRLCSLAQNNQNAKCYSGLGVKGVRQEGAVFSARIQSKPLGYYSTLQLAALAYDREARLVFGEFAKLNYPEVTDYSEVMPLPPRNIGERTSAQVGVSFSHKRKAKQKWRAVYRKNHLGWFVTEEEAVKCYLEAKNESS